MAANRMKKNVHRKDEKPKVRLKEKITEALELPKEVILNIPKITIFGCKDILIENYKGIIEYDNERIRINTGSGVIKITGSNLNIREITSEDVIVNGIIDSIEFLR
ncbi:MAG TPA: sporulation protein YqfC [Clostridiaceae bacterium]|nr:sporulation protein YqfC [Clostridiaceae bacterium]